MDQDSIIFFEIFPWDKRFETGIPQIDEQHKELVNIMNRLAAHVANLSASVTLNEIFAELADYASYHFETEEAVWAKYFKDDDWYVEHQKTHQSFIEKVVTLKGLESEKPLEEVVQEIVSFLSQWLAYHILESDKRMAIVIKTIESGATIQRAKSFADEEMSGAVKTVIETVLKMYSSLSTRTLDLMRETTLRKRAEHLAEQRTAELRKHMEELELFSKMASGREQQMIKLKKEINDLLKQLGRDEKYAV